MLPLHHVHRRKKHSPKKFSYGFLDRLIYLGAVLGPVMTVPQITLIWVQKDASGVSSITWGSYLAVSFIWLLYGFVHKEKPIIFGNIFAIVVQALVLGGTLLYK